MTIQQAITKSIEGGWEPKYDFAIETPHQIYFTDDGSILLTGEGGKNLGIYDIEKIILDPLFWQALGKAMGWRDTINDGGVLTAGDVEIQTSWVTYWHRLIDALAVGKSIEDYFAKL